MGETSIEWCHYTFNPWWGCVKVSPLCDNCYAESLAKRYGHHVWGPDAPRRFFGEKHWKEPLRWHRNAEHAGERKRVFCASQADVFETPGVDLGRMLSEERLRLWALIRQTWMLDWMLLTKRPGNIRKLLPPAWTQRPPPNVWLGASAGTRATWKTMTAQLRAAPRPWVRFISCEPLLQDLGELDLTGLDLVIVGGESGPRARTMDFAWARAIRDQCRSAGVAFFFKQDGSRPSDRRNPSIAARRTLIRVKGKGNAEADIPPDLRIKQMPEGARMRWPA